MPAAVQGELLVVPQHLSSSYLENFIYGDVVLMRCTPT